MKKVSSFLSDLQAFQYSKTVSAPRVSIQRGARKTKTLGKNAYVYRLVMNAKLIETAKIQSAKFITFFADPEKQDLYFTIAESPNNNMLSVTQGKNNIYSVSINTLVKEYPWLTSEAHLGNFPLLVTDLQTGDPILAISEVDLIKAENRLFKIDFTNNA